MFNVNTVVLGGRSCSDPEIRDTPNSRVATIRLAVNERVKKGGEWQDETLYVDCDAWAKKVDYVEKHVGRGTPLLVEGKLRMDTWEKDGKNHQKLKLYVTNLQVDFLEKSRDGQRAANKPAAAPTGGDNLPF